MFFRSSSVFLTALSSVAFGQNYLIQTFAGGALPISIPGTSASLNGPSRVAVDQAGNLLFTDRHTVLQLNKASGVLSLIAGNGAAGYTGDNGPATSAQLNQPSGIAIDRAGNLYIADAGNQRIRKVSPSGVITTVVSVAQPSGIAVDANGNLYMLILGPTVS